MSCSSSFSLRGSSTAFFSWLSTAILSEWLASMFILHPFLMSLPCGAWNSQFLHARVCCKQCLLVFHACYTHLVWGFALVLFLFRPTFGGETNYYTFHFVTWFMWWETGNYVLLWCRNKCTVCLKCLGVDECLYSLADWTGIFSSDRWKPVTRLISN